MRDKVFSKKEFIASVTENVKTMYRKTLKEATQQEIYQAVSLAVKDVVMDEWMATQQVIEKDDPKILYYMSMEFLMGRALGNNLINLGAYGEVKEALEEIGLDLSVIEDQEPDPALGNGGLGRLAACFMDSLATLGYAAYGCGIRYRYGMFKQQIIDGFQIEVPDNWLKNGYPFELRRPEYSYEVKFGGYVRAEVTEEGKTRFIQENYQSVLAVPYDMPIVGYGNHVVDTLMIWDAEPMECFELDSFDKGDYHKAVEQENLARNLVEVLYPNDNHIAGKELRLKQQYFFVSASLQRAIARFKKHHEDIHQLPEKAVFQMNDTHPTVAVAELMRILLDEEGLSWEDAWDITTHCVAYTNHTIMAEALEKWPLDMFRKILPRVYMIVEEMNRRLMIRLNEVYPNDSAKHKYMAIISDNQIFMANMCLASCFAVNGVSKLHTDILKQDIFADYYNMNNDHFYAITNGITFRRWIANCNPELTELISSKIGKNWIKDASELSKLKKYAKDPAFKKQFAEIKRNNKVRLAQYIKEHNDIVVNPDSIFDVQCKRLHEYKRQMMNVLHILAEYNRIIEDNVYAENYYPKTYIFGAKAAPGYKRAKLIIKLINSVGDMINNDPRVKDKIKVVFLENYSVSIAEKLIIAADISEQISTAGKEASGTGNMKFMLNGALTIGTLDGANVEMLEQVGEDNIYIFGLKADEVAARVKYAGTDEVKNIYSSNASLRHALEQLVDGSIVPGSNQMFRDLYQTLLFGDYGFPDTYMVIRDFEEYMKTQEKMSADYQDRDKWIEKAILNTASAGFFSSDRTIEDYNKNIWHLTPIK